jgi:hypothetical protein
MFRQSTAIFLLLAFALMVFNREVIILDYYANTSTYARNCENKTQPLKMCNGKCQMLKKLKTEEKKDQQNPERLGTHKLQVESSKSFFPVLYIQQQTTSTILLVSNHTSYPKGTDAAIFHPPV